MNRFIQDALCEYRIEIIVYAILEALQLKETYHLY